MNCLFDKNIQDPSSWSALLLLYFSVTRAVAGMAAKVDPTRV